ncbi:MAG: cytochrome c oxidase subunit 3 [candidate division WOR-3 bacterium]|nr:cytochrome c oxidase subunit 3 [candidate division WOR-3 bacterium]MCX7948383.1 cytochrome c oxidase subunit 3 [candidate division WOR-3 bacterium]MDW8151167.1 cytochrome c oxidase subunit 3 [candidate division WOR-3 bacterium]
METKIHEEHVEVSHKDDFGAKLGMWLFLATELLLFAGLFTAYFVFRGIYLPFFHEGQKELQPIIGLVNSIVLFIGGLTAVLSISAVRKDKKSHLLLFLTITILTGIVFLFIKAYEYGLKFEHGLFFNMEHFKNLPNGEKIFFSLYFVMTGIHALHVLIGIILFLFILFFAIRNSYNSKNFIQVEIAGLYWCLVDLIWMYLFPLLYLVK